MICPHERELDVGLIHLEKAILERTVEEPTTTAVRALFRIIVPAWSECGQGESEGGKGGRGVEMENGGKDRVEGTAAPTEPVTSL